MAIHQQRAQEITLGATIALPLLALAIASGRRALPATLKRWDERLGNLAYPVFITHCLAFYVVEHITGMAVSATAGFLISAVAVCLAGSLALEQLQRRVERLRIGLRGFASMKHDRLSADALARRDRRGSGVDVAHDRTARRGALRQAGHEAHVLGHGLAEFDVFPALQHRAGNIEGRQVQPQRATLAGAISLLVS